MGACALLADRGDLQVLLIAGPAHADEMRRALGDVSRALAVRVEGFVDRIDLAYAAADLVVARAGASSIAEVAVCGLPALLVPYPHATADHQEANARALQRAGGATVLPDDELSPETPGRPDRRTLIDQRDRLAAMSRRGRSRSPRPTPPTVWPTWSRTWRRERAARRCRPSTRRREASRRSTSRTRAGGDGCTWSGIGGAGMRGLAHVLLARGVSVSGSDLKDSAGAGGAAEPRGRRSSSATTPTTSARPTRWSSPPRFRRPTRRCVRPATPACRC